MRFWLPKNLKKLKKDTPDRLGCLLDKHTGNGYTCEKAKKGTSRIQRKVQKVTGWWEVHAESVFEYIPELRTEHDIHVIFMIEASVSRLRRKATVMMSEYVVLNEAD